MFETWASPALAAVLAGAALWGVLLTPLLLYQVRAYGGLNYRRVFGAGLVSIYGVALVAYTLLPTPGAETWCSTDHEGAIELNASHSIGDIQWAVSRFGLIGSLTSFTVLQVVMNIVLFIPWGVFARRYFHMPFILAVLSGAFASLGIELAQYAGGWTFIGCQYRVADIDDLIANTLGALLGALIAPLVLSWMPAARRLTRERLDPREVSGLRRAASVVIDLVIVWGVALAVFQLVAWLAPVSGSDAAAAGRHALALGAGGLVALLPTLGGSGASIGERTLWLRPQTRTGTAPGRGRTVLRGLAGTGVYAGLAAWGSSVEGVGLGAEVIVVAAHAYGATLVLWAGIDPRGGLADAMTGCTTVDARGRTPSTGSGPQASGLVP
ncbi:VanZ family protein [Demequina zhanjiangensis]|uniref:VanZ family protein n=1 Tax=Demequina zhanjiangensis TaxID=3051659 RepID=A0ABT8G4Z5_9MICO|nr:VanZ family protein [Demequina sp. SYSU T00b26]MDN4474216.1 VanZ family protein [Demequina sp. SYSU T00b26]